MTAASSLYVNKSLAVGRGRIQQSLCRRRRGGPRSRRLLGVRVVLSITLGLLLWCFSGQFFKMLALYSRCMMVLTDRTRHCCAYSVTRNQLLLSVNPKHGDGVPIKCICSNAFGNEQSCCDAMQCLNASNRLTRLFWKVLSHVYICCVDDEVGKCVCRCSHRCIHVMLPQTTGLKMCLLCITCMSISVEGILASSSLWKFSK